MSAGDFQKTSWGWQLSQIEQQVGEWVELQFSRFKPSLPEWSLPSWLNDTLWLLLGLLLIWLSWQLWQQFSRVLYSWSQKENSAGMTATTRSRELTGDEWLQRSQAYLRQGDYREACRCLYLAMLQRLNDTGIALHQPSRTDGEYLQLVQQMQKPQPYQTLIATHEQICFGNAEILPETFEQCRQAYREVAQ